MNRKVWMLITSMSLGAAAGVRAEHDVDRDAWLDGDVEVSVRLSGGEGAVYAPGDKVRVEIEANDDAYHLVYAIDTDGSVRVLFPRFWEDDGWLPGGEHVTLRSRDLAWPADRWGDDGIVYIEAVASPEPFDWQSLGFVHADYCQWLVGGRPYRIHGDPFLAFNDIHQRLFPDWSDAVFTVDYTYFYVGSRRDAPRYLGYRYERVYVDRPNVDFGLAVRFGWGWDFGRSCARPVYRRYYVPGRHVVHHYVRDRHHVDYRPRYHTRRDDGEYRQDRREHSNRDVDRVKHRIDLRTRHRDRQRSDAPEYRRHESRGKERQEHLAPKADRHEPHRVAPRTRSGAAVEKHDSGSVRVRKPDDDARATVRERTGKRTVKPATSDDAKRSDRKRRVRQ